MRSLEARSHVAVPLSPLSQVVRWMSLWVFGLVIYLFKDLVQDGFKAVYGWVAALFQRVADNMYSRRNLKQNLELPPEETQRR